MTARKRKQEGEPVLGSMLTLRVSPALLTRLDALVPKLAAGADELPMMLGRVSRADVCRLAMIEGLKVLERRYVK